MEDWRPIEEFPGYTVNSQGKVRAIYFLDKSRCLKPILGKRGYYYVNLHKDGKSYSRYIHRLIAIAFLPNPENKSQIDHINRNCVDNRLENLRWVTPHENSLNTDVGITGERYITCQWRVCVYGHKPKCFKTKEEAIQYRNSLTNQDGISE